MLDQKNVATYLGEKLSRSLTVTKLKRTFPGLSRETWLVWTSDTTPGESGYVLRIDPPGGPICPVEMQFEYQVYKTLHGTPIPVARPLWYDDSPQLTGGRPLMVRELVAGSTALPGIYDSGAEADARRQRVAFEHAEKLAALHTLDWKSYGFETFMDAPASAEHAPLHEFERICELWRQLRTDPMPLVTETLYWFRENLPGTAPRVSLCKGNSGLGEEIWKDDHIVALSDWELASLGDPTRDWALSQGMLAMGKERTVLEHYEQLAGFQVPEENLTFWCVWEIFYTLCILNSGLRAFIDGADTRIARANLGLGRAKMLETLLGMIVGKPMDEALAIVVKWRKSPYAPG